MAHERNLYPESIKDAALLLDTVRPYWYNDIQTQTLEMNDMRNCVLGKLYGTYAVGLRTLFDMDNRLGEAYNDCVFGIRADVNRWIEEIRYRKANNSPQIKEDEVKYLDFTEVLKALIDGKIVYDHFEKTTVKLTNGVIRDGNQKYAVLDCNHSYSIEKVYDLGMGLVCRGSGSVLYISIPCNEVDSQYKFMPINMYSKGITLSNIFNRMVTVKEIESYNLHIIGYGHQVLKVN